MGDKELTRLLHDNMATVMTFVFSQAPIKRLINERVMPPPGSKKGLLRPYPEGMHDFSFEVPHRNATRACREIAVLMRLIYEQIKDKDRFGLMTPARLGYFGVVHRTDETTELLSLPELTNKIIHAKDLSWDLSNEKAPKLICTAPAAQQERFKWVRAEVDIVSLAFFCDRFSPERV
jgi:hypothetical protein